MSEILSEDRLIELLAGIANGPPAKEYEKDWARIIASQRALRAERDTLEQRLRDICQAYGPALIHMHDLEKERDALKAELSALKEVG